MRRFWIYFALYTSTFLAFSGSSSSSSGYCHNLDFDYNPIGLATADVEVTAWYNNWDVLNMPKKGELFYVTDKACEDKCPTDDDKYEFPCRPIFLERTLLWKKGGKHHVVKKGQNYGQCTFSRDSVTPQMVAGNSFVMGYNQEGPNEVCPPLCRRHEILYKLEKNYNTWMPHVMSKKIHPSKGRAYTDKEYEKIIVRDWNATRYDGFEWPEKPKRCQVDNLVENVDCNFIVQDQPSKSIPEEPHTQNLFLSKGMDNTVIKNSSNKCSWKDMVTGNVGGKHFSNLLDAVQFCLFPDFLGDAHRRFDPKLLKDKDFQCWKKLAGKGYKVFNNEWKSKGCNYAFAKRMNEVNGMGDLFFSRAEIETACPDSMDGFYVCNVDCKNGNKNEYTFYESFEKYMDTKITDKVRL